MYFIYTVKQYKSPAYLNKSKLLNSSNALWPSQDILLFSSKYRIIPFFSLLVYLCFLYLIYKQLQYEGGDAPINTNKEVDGGQNHISCARYGENKRRWVHQRSYGPPIEEKQRLYLCRLWEEWMGEMKWIETLFTERKSNTKQRKGKWNTVMHPNQAILL